MRNLIPDFPVDGVVTVNRVILKDGHIVAMHPAFFYL